ncbi:MAG: HD domain-containing protein [Bacteroidota bacterium]
MNYQAAKEYILKRLKEELSDQLYYHGIHHTLDVLAVTEELCTAESVKERERVLLRTAALYHDCGFLVSNQEHERRGCEIAQEVLPTLGYDEQAINQICGMIMATKIPQSPQTLLEEIICDADLDYLGREDFYPIGNTLFEELKAFKVLSDEESWNRIQVNFLENHHFFTATNITRRSPQKAVYLEELKKIVEGYKKN